MPGGQTKGRVLLGLSGGVDSAVAAALLLERGYEVTGARMSVYDGEDDGSLTSGCYGRRADDDAASAAALARRLGIDFRVIDCAAAWRREVLDYFRAEYLAGRTPNPCVRCNEMVKFGALWRGAERVGLDFDYFATGHYARIENAAEHGGPVLRRGADAGKDQSYFLYRLSRQTLGRLIFPLGDLTKPETRRLAEKMGLPVHDRPDSQDFYGGDYIDLIGAPDRQGSIIDASGRVLGRHRGFWRYTPGQRKGLGVSAPTPLYVLRVNAERNEVVVGPAGQNSFSGCIIDDCRFTLPEPEPGGRYLARMRSSQPLKEVTVVKKESGRFWVDFADPMGGLAPGQSLVLYQGDLVVGGGIIQGPNGAILRRHSVEVQMPKPG